MRLVSILSTLVASAVSRATINMVFHSSKVTVAPGGSFSILATMSNSGPQKAFVDGSTITIAPMDDFSVDDFPFLLAAPASGLAPVGSFDGDVDVTIGATVPVGIYHFEYSAIGHLDDNSPFDVPASFDINVQAVPEPTTLAALAGGVALMRRRRKC